MNKIKLYNRVMFSLLFGKLDFNNVNTNDLNVDICIYLTNIRSWMNNVMFYVWLTGVIKRMRDQERINMLLEMLLFIRKGGQL